MSDDAMGTSDIPGAGLESLRRFHVGEYHRMIEAGVLDEDEHVELLDGMIVKMAPQGTPHGFAIQELTRLLVQGVGDALRVRCQLPLTLGAHDEPEPDLAVVRAVDATLDQPHPGSALLVVEVASDSLRKDRKHKGRLYARHGLPEYWIVNLVDATIEVYRDVDASAERYRTTAIYRPGQSISVATIPGLVLAVDDVLRR